MGPAVCSETWQKLDKVSLTQVEHFGLSGMLLVCSMQEKTCSQVSEELDMMLAQQKI